jgi:hypothetical protein
LLNGPRGASRILITKNSFSGVVGLRLGFSLSRNEGSRRKKHNPAATPEKKSTKDTHMTDMKKTANDKAPAKRKKLQLN